MNYFAHARRFLDRPYFAAGTGVPDWLSVVDRRVRVRQKHAEPFLTHDDEIVRAVAGGIIQHLIDDDWFHRTRAFGELSWQFTVSCRDALPGDDGLRPRFLGHILVELLLDDALSKENPELLDAYHDMLDGIDPSAVRNAVNLIAPRPAEHLAYMIDQFRKLRILEDYADDDRLLKRLNQVMKRVKLQPLPETFKNVFPDARQAVTERKDELLEGENKYDNSQHSPET
jgi:hypothetical protein